MSPTMVDGTMLSRLENKIRASLIDGSEPWPLPASEVQAIQSLFVQLGLKDEIPNGYHTTELGDVLHLDLLMVFLSIWDAGEVPERLLDHGLISEDMCQHLLAVDFTYADLKPLVRNAYATAQERGLLRLRLT